MKVNKIQPKIELHLHLDGAARWSTLYELMRKKKLPLPGDGSIQDFMEACATIKQCKSIKEFISHFNVFIPAFFADQDAIERIAYELCEDQANNGVIYFEARCAPQLLVNSSHLPPNNVVPLDDPSAVTADMMIQSMLSGLKRGEEDFGVKSRLLLCLLRGFSQFNEEILDLCTKFKDRGVAGIDIAGDEATEFEKIKAGDKKAIAELKNEIHIFEEAKRRNIHRTAHAAEVGPAEVAKISVEQMYTERIGHGYHIVDDDDIYALIRDKNIHLECCPQSSMVTSAVHSIKNHPILRFANDDVNFSINSDDPTLTTTRIWDDFLVAKSFGLSDKQLIKGTYNAARSAFISDEEKMDLIKILDKAYGGCP